MLTKQSVRSLAGSSSRRSARSILRSFTCVAGTQGSATNARLSSNSSVNAARVCSASIISRISPRTCVVTKRLYSSSQSADLGPRESDQVDVCIVGGGPAGLAAAIKLKQLDNEKGSGDLRVVVLEKSPDMGNHIVSGAVLEPRALDELIPNWRDDENLPSTVTPAGEEAMRFLTKSSAIPIPEPPQMHNKGNYIVSLSQMVGWLAAKAEEVGVEVYPGFSVSELIFNEQGQVKGIATNDMGLSKNFEPKANFERGMEFHAKVTLLAEGCHGSLTKQVIKRFDLRKDSDPQTYGLGIKEVWQVKEEKFKKGYIGHTMGYPLSKDVYGGGFMYHFGDGLVSVGLVVGLDYANPYISPYQEFQRMKHHPFYADVLKGGECIAYGARALNEGGYQSIPKLSFPGGALIGCTAGFLNVPKIKGTHTAMKSGMLAAETAFEAISQLPEPAEAVEESETDEMPDQPLIDMTSYEESIKNSWVYKELYEVRNIRPSFHNPLKLYGGIMYSGLDTLLLKGRVPWTFRHKETDAAATESADKFEKIEYPKPDGELSFDILTSVSRTGTLHDEDEPCHLRVPDQDMDKHAEAAYPRFKGIENRFCPAGVYEYIEDETKPLGVRFQINSQNCIHCKTCDIKVPTQDINWTVPEGGDGPKYSTT